MVSPLKQRSCTDIICLLLFLVFFGAWIALGVYGKEKFGVLDLSVICEFLAFISGDPGEIFAPRDSSGKKCGYDEDVADKPYLVFFDLTKCVPGAGKLLKCDTPEVSILEINIGRWPISFQMKYKSIAYEFLKNGRAAVSFGARFVQRYQKQLR